MKITNIVLALVSLVLTIMNVVLSMRDGKIIDLTSLVTLAPMIFTLYSELDWFYIKINKIRAYFEANTVLFSPKFQYDTDMEITLQDLEKNFRNILSRTEHTINESRSIPNTHEDLYFKVKSYQGRIFDATINLHQNGDLKKIILKFEYQISYRDVQNSWNEFDRIRNDFFANYSMSNSSDQRYEVIIQTDQTKFNPFYRLTVRHIGAKQIERFSLDFTDGDLRVKSTLHQIYGVSRNSESIKKMINEYVPLSKIL
ncbi:hypothetical protein ACQUFH_11910 [Lactococcus lactis]|uniref:hypothetical protein n=1 Tax=Lactococcus lactis TaxID=1358 RepID=UPI003D0FDA8D